VRRTLIYKFEKDFKEDNVYSITNFGVVANSGSYRATRHEYKLNFQFHTKVKLCNSKKVSSDIYMIESPIPAFSLDYDTNYLYGKKY
jgi:replication factor A1